MTSFGLPDMAYGILIKIQDLIDQKERQQYNTTLTNSVLVLRFHSGNFGTICKRNYGLNFGLLQNKICFAYHIIYNIVHTISLTWQFFIYTADWKVYAFLKFNVICIQLLSWRRSLRMYNTSPNTVMSQVCILAFSMSVVVCYPTFSALQIARYSLNTVSWVTYNPFSRVQVKMTGDNW